MLETFIKDFGPYWHGSITQLLQICQLHIHDANLPFYHHPKYALLDWDLVTVEAIWVKWTYCHVQETSLRWFELCDMLHYPAGISHQKMVQCSQRDGHGQQQYSGRLWHLNNVQLVLRGPNCAKSIPTPLHHQHQPEPLRQGRRDPCFHVLYAKFWPYHLNVTAEN